MRLLCLLMVFSEVFGSCPDKVSQTEKILCPKIAHEGTCIDQCPTGHKQTESVEVMGTIKSCEECPEGSSGDGTLCTPCAAGLYSQSGASTCCAAGSYSQSGASTCSDCKPIYGATSVTCTNSEDSVPVSCWEGWSLTETNECRALWRL